MTGPALLDVNMLVALFDPDHIHHETAHARFESSGSGSFATCPLTENGLVSRRLEPGLPGTSNHGRRRKAEAEILLRAGGSRVLAGFRLDP